MKKLPGVESVKVSLNEGKAAMELKPGNSVSIEQIRKAITDQGFTPKEATVTAIGDLSGSNGKLQFKVRGTNDVFPVMETPHAQWRKLEGNNLSVSGLIQPPAQANAKEPGLMQITQVSSQANQKGGSR